METNVGNAVKFECEVEDAPEVSFTWFKDGHQVHEGHKYTIISRSRTSCLQILQPIKEDSGEYTCRVSNQHGGDECSAPLTVTGKNVALSFFLVELGAAGWGLLSGGCWRMGQLSSPAGQTLALGLSWSSFAALCLAASCSPS